MELNIMQMKNSIIVLSLVALFSVVAFTSCTEGDLVQPDYMLTEEEKNGLLYLREEEKMARDVYLHFSDIYSLEIFSNISKSEQIHMDKILDLLNKYHIEDPAVAERGIFTNAVIQDLYNSLIELGDSSEVHALGVGALIEDVDIYDLTNFSKGIDNTDLLNVYQKLICASGNHIRAFTNQLASHGETFTPQHISQEDYNRILSSENGQCGQ